jgi:hypothetical protein
MSSGNFFAELKRRNVIRMAGLYSSADFQLGRSRADHGPE